MDAASSAMSTTGLRTTRIIYQLTSNGEIGPWQSAQRRSALSAQPAPLFGGRLHGITQFRVIGAAGCWRRTDQCKERK